jgi:hypothetical protein
METGTGLTRAIIAVIEVQFNGLSRGYFIYVFVWPCNAGAPSVVIMVILWLLHFPNGIYFNIEASDSIVLFSKSKYAS